MKTLASILIFVVVAAGARYLVGAVITQEQVRQVEQRASDPKSQPVVSEETIRAEFMSTCDVGSTPGLDQTEYCTCTFEILVEEKGINWMINLGLKGTDAEIEAVVMPVAERCVNEQLSLST